MQAPKPAADRTNEIHSTIQPARGPWCSEGSAQRSPGRRGMPQNGGDFVTIWIQDRKKEPDR